MPKPLRLLTWNVKFLPPYVKRFRDPKIKPIGWWEVPERGGISDEQRAVDCLAAIVAGDYDVIVLQEVFQETVRRHYREELGKLGYETSGPLGNDVFNDDSGLFIATRVPMSWLRFVEFAAKKLPDSLSDKGIVILALDTTKWFGPAMHTLYVFGVHMQANDENVAVRAKQIAQLSKVAHSVLRSVTDPAHVGMVSCGDFNVPAEAEVIGGAAAARVPTDEYRGMIATLGRPRDTYRAAHTDGGFTIDGKINGMTRADNDEQKRIDYVFLHDFVPERHPEVEPRALGALRCAKVRVEPFLPAGDGARHLSDHFGVSVELTAGEGE